MALLLTIQAAAQEVGVTPSTMRIYEALGLISPSRDSVGRRLFSAADVAEAKKIKTQRLATRGSGLRGAARPAA